MTQISAKHILVGTLTEATELQQKLSEGSSFDQLAQQYSKCPSGRNGGNLGVFGKGMMVKSFEDDSFALDVGQISEPVQTQFGYHIIQRIS